MNVQVIYGNSGTARNEMEEEEEEVPAREDDDHSKCDAFVDHENKGVCYFFLKKKNSRYDQLNCVFMMRYRKDCSAGEQVKTDAQYHSNDCL